MARVVAIEGVPAIAMPEFAPFLQQRDSRVLRVWQTNPSESKGRFNLETDQLNLYPLAKTMDSDIKSIYVDFLRQRSPVLPDLPSFPDPPHMASNMNVDREESESTYTHNLSRDVPSTCCPPYSNISLSTLGMEEDDLVDHFPSLGHSYTSPPTERPFSTTTTPPVNIIKLPLYVIIHYNGNYKAAALTLHIKPLGPSWENGRCGFHFNSRLARSSNSSPPPASRCHGAPVGCSHCQILTLQR
jgi:hypothetical protein